MTNNFKERLITLSKNKLTSLVLLVYIIGVFILFNFSMLDKTSAIFLYILALLFVGCLTSIKSSPSEDIVRNNMLIYVLLSYGSFAHDVYLIFLVLIYLILNIPMNTINLIIFIILMVIFIFKIENCIHEYFRTKLF